MSKELTWTEYLVAKFIQTKLHIQDSASFDLIEQFKESEQPKPEWEILRVVGLKSKMTANYVPEYHNNENWKIHSVRRLSDNSTWAIGDRFRADAGCDLTIKEFKVSEEGMEVWSNEYGYWLLNTIRPMPLFITDDLKEAYVNDEVWAIRKDDWKLDGASFMASFASKSIGDNKDKNNFWYFSTKEAAEEYIINNKPCLSLMDVLSCDRKTESEQKFISILKSLVQSKITPKPTTDER